MAITINTNPSGTPSLHDDLWHVVQSTNSAVTDFKYVFEIYVGAVLKATIKQFPEPSNSRGYFNAANIVRNSLTFNWFEPTNSGVYVIQPDITSSMAVAYTIKVGEEYGGTTYLNLANATVTAYNWAPPLFKRRVITMADKLLKWLTNRPSDIYADLTENIFIGFYTNTALTLHCEKYNVNNTIIGSTLNGTSTTVTNGFVQCNIGTTALAATLSTTFDDTVKYYDIWFNSLPKVRVYIKCNNKYSPVLLHFLNKWGTYDTQRFDLVSRLMMDVERKSYSQKDVVFNGAAVDYKSTSNRYYESKINYSNKADFTYKITTDAMSDADYQWLADLITSPQILMELEGYFYPVTIKNTSYEFSKSENNRLKVLELELELNAPRYSQLR
jgi:hypothetical protein